jgi:hypothetical protein
MSIQNGVARCRALALLCTALALASVHSPDARGAGSGLTIAGPPVRSVAASQYYSFQPSAQDTRARALTFSITGKPAWAQFDPSTGRLFGSVTAANVGFYPDIVISVNDGVAQAAMPAFSVIVLPLVRATNAVTLTWEPPTENTDSSALVDLAGYHVYFSPVAQNLRNSRLDFANPGMSSVVVSGLTSGLWYFAVAAYNSQGVEGELSSILLESVN